MVGLSAIQAQGDVRKYEGPPGGPVADPVAGPDADPVAGPVAGPRGKTWGDVFYEYCPGLTSETLKNPKQTLGAGAICAGLAWTFKAIIPLRLVSYYFFSKSLATYCAQLRAEPSQILNRAVEILNGEGDFPARAKQALAEVQTLPKENPNDAEWLKLEQSLKTLSEDLPEHLEVSQVFQTKMLNQLMEAARKATPPLTKRISNRSILGVGQVVSLLDYGFKIGTIEVVAKGIMGKK